MIKYLLTELGRAGREDIWPEVGHDVQTSRPYFSLSQNVKCSGHAQHVLKHNLTIESKFFMHAHNMFP